jgi:hypothetical protein
MARSKAAKQNFLLAQYVNDRPYVASFRRAIATAEIMPIFVHILGARPVSYWTFEVRTFYLQRRR